MATLFIHREHLLGLVDARALALEWAAQAKSDWGMQTSFTPGNNLEGAHDTVEFHRTGVRGSLQVNAKVFVLRAELGFLLGSFKEQIEAQIIQNLDKRLAHART
jgi:putative polyhydroxyalkanoate system protein